MAYLIHDMTVDEINRVLRLLQGHSNATKGTSTSASSENVLGTASVPSLSGTSAGQPYTLPIATSVILGGVKPDGTSVLNSNGAISVTPYSAGAIPYTGLWFDVANLVYETTLSYNLATKTLSITPTGSTWRAWVQGVLFTFTGVQTISHAGTQGLWFIYVNPSGVVSASQTPWNILNVAPIALLYYDPLTPDYWLYDERHHYDSPVEWHQSQHFGIGTFVQNPATDFPISGYTLNTATDAGVRFALGSGTVVDEDINVLTTAIAAGGPYQVIYQSGSIGVYIRKQVTYPFVYDSGTGYIQYNSVSGTPGLADVATGQFVNYYLFVTPGYDGVTPKQILLVPDTQTFSSLVNAQAGTPGILVLSQFVEIAVMYQITFSVNSANANNGKCAIASVKKIVQSRNQLARD